MRPHALFWLFGASIAGSGCILADHDFSGYRPAPEEPQGDGSVPVESTAPAAEPSSPAPAEHDSPVSVPAEGGAGGSPSCQPHTCAELGVECGKVSDGCGHDIACGSCPAPSICVEGVVNLCLCQPTSCDAKQAQCGTIDDGCGGELDCGKCGSKHECEENRCVKDD
jgi:hypothetical protein